MKERDYGIAPPGYRLPDATHVGTVTLQVSDLARSVAFYQDVLGFQVAENTQGSARLSAHDDERTLLALVERRGARPVPTGGRLGLYHFAILLPNRASLGGFLAHVQARGVQPGSADHLVSEALYLNDPDGLGIEVYADRPRDMWRSTARQLAMDSLPLDAPGLLAAAGARPWTGMPLGTTIGHVHLHVGDINQADAFYHVALGFDRVVWSYPGALFLSAGGYHHHLGINTWARGAQPAGAEDAKLLDWEIVVPDVADIAAVAASLEGAGHVVERAERGVAVADPWGTQVSVVAGR